MKPYLAWVRELPRLTPEAAKELAAAVLRGDAKAREALVVAHLPLVVQYTRWVTKHFPVRRPVTWMDLISEGNLALSEAAARYDPARGVAFSVYARPWVVHRILRLVFLQAQTVPLSAIELKEAVKEAHLPRFFPLEGIPPGFLATPPPQVEAYTHAEQRDRVEQLLSRLNPKEQFVLRARFGLLDGEPWSLAAVGRALSISRERVRQIQQAALRQLRTLR